jgi:ribosomal protein S18 acetylase RimI-like enzyme
MREVTTRYIAKDDLKKLGELDRENENDIINLLTGHEVVNGMVAETNDVVGFCIYSLENPETFSILHLVVDKDFCRKGIGTKIINRMKSKLNEQRKILDYEVPESYLDMQLFLKAMGFKAILIRNKHEDIFKFTYTENK